MYFPDCLEVFKQRWIIFLQSCFLCLGPFYKIIEVFTVYMMVSRVCNFVQVNNCTTTGSFIHERYVCVDS